MFYSAVLFVTTLNFGRGFKADSLNLNQTILKLSHFLIETSDLRTAHLLLIKFQGCVCSAFVLTVCHVLVYVVTSQNKVCKHEKER